MVAALVRALSALLEPCEAAAGEVRGRDEGWGGGLPHTAPRVPVTAADGGFRRVASRFAVLTLVVVGALFFVWGDDGPTAPGDPGAPAAPAAPATPPPAQPIAVEVDATDIEPMDNDRLFGQDPQVPDGAAASATREISTALETYLNAQFVAPATRFSQRPLDGLLSRPASAALSRDLLAGLGALGISVWQVEGEPVTAQARVLTRGDSAAIVTVRYDLRAQVHHTAGDPVPLRQEATMVFVRQDGGWRVDAVDAVLDLPLRASEGAR
jgi:hypothetical protein